LAGHCLKVHQVVARDKFLDKSKHLGAVDMGTVEQEEKVFDPEEADRQVGSNSSVASLPAYLRMIF
jgi:hypothetical protein